MIETAIKRIVDRGDLTREEMHAVFGQMMDGAVSDAQKAALLVSLRMKGETPEEITGAALAMRERVTPLDVPGDGLVDTCGTGGDGAGTFNISTVAALVAAGAGARVAKHGNRAVSSSCGSADVLSELGVAIDLDAPRMTEVLRRTGISFLFAPKLHPAMGAVAAVRRQLGVRTIFNVLGPLTNPAFARRQVMGVYSSHLVEVVAHVLLSLGAVHALVVHSDDGLDEISVSAATKVGEVSGGEVRCYWVDPGRIGVGTHPREALGGGDVATNASIARAVLEGRGTPAQEDVVIANAAAALYVSGGAGTIAEGVRIAREALQAGEALRKLEELVSVTRELA